MSLLEPWKGVAHRVYAGVGVLCLLGGLCASTTMAQGPAWWAARNVLNTNSPDDFAIVNLGQLRHVAKMAYDEMESALSGGGWSRTRCPGGKPCLYGGR